MNPRYSYVPYGAQQYQYRLPAPTSYYMPYFHPDLGMQYVYLQPYPQMPVLTCDPYSYGQSMHVMVRPPFPPPPPIFQPPLVPQQIPNNVRMTRPRADRPVNPQTSKGAAAAQNVRNAERNTETAKSGTTDAKVHSRSKNGTNEVSNCSIRQRRSLPKKARRKRVKRSQKTKKFHGTHVSNVHCEDLSSINTDSTQVRSKPDVEGCIGGDDDEYETCDEEDLAEKQNEVKGGSMTQTTYAQSERGTHGANVPKPPLSTGDGCRRYVPLYSAREDYWAAISGIESIWNPSDDSMLCRNRGNGCKCKQCSSQPARFIVPPTPELWWDRSVGMELWPETRDQNFDSNAPNHPPATNSHQTAGYILIDANQTCVDGHDVKGVDQAGEASIDNNDNLPKRRLLSVDWSSISTSNVDGNTLRTNSNIEHKIKSITEVDSAILERGPLTTESFSLPIIMQPSVAGNLLTSAMPNSGGLHINVPSERMNDGKRLITSGVQGYFQTAFTSNDISNPNALEHKTGTMHDGGAEATLNLKSSVDRGAERTEIEPLSAAKGVEMPGLDETDVAAAGLELQEKNVNGMSAEEIDHIDATVDSLKAVDLPASNSCVVTVDSKLDKGKEDTDIPPDSIEIASVEGRRKVVVEHRPHFRNGFQFPQSDQVFRERVDADSATPDDNDGRLETVNKKIYEDSKPTPCTTDDIPITAKIIRTEPASPVNCARLLSRRRSLSLNDLQRAAERDRKSRDVHRLDKKPPSATVSDFNITGKGAKNRLNVCKYGNDDKKETTDDNTSKIEKPKRAWKHNANRTKYPTGIPLNSMLNDTIRRNFRQKASPVAIFELYRPTTDISSANLVSIRQPSIDDWSEVMVGPVPVGTYCMQQTLVSKNPGLQAARYDETASHYLPVPVVLYPSTSLSKPRSSDHVSKPRARRQIVKRRNSFTGFQHVSTTQNRKARFQHHGVAKSNTAATTLRYTSRTENVAASESNPTTSTLKSKIGSNRSKKCEDKSDKTCPQAQASADFGKVNMTKQNDRNIPGSESGANKNITHDKSAEATHAPALMKNETLKGAPQKVEKNPADEQRGVDHEGKALKESFLKRMIKRKKWNKQSTLHETKVAVCDTISNSQFHPKRKPSRQEKIRANITSKKNRLLGRSTKPRLRELPSFVTQDHNGNSPQPDLTESEECATISKRELRPKESGKREPREDKNVKHALYRPTLICMAAIETPAQPGVDPISQNTTNRIVNESNRHPRLLDANSSLPGPINQGREDKSVAGTPGVRINSETGDVIETSDIKLMATFLCSTKIAENENINCES